MPDLVVIGTTEGPCASIRYQLQHLETWLGPIFELTDCVGLLKSDCSWFQTWKNSISDFPEKTSQDSKWLKGQVGNRGKFPGGGGVRV